MNHLEIAIQASIEAGKRIMEVYRTTFSVEMKEDRTPLTLADRESHRVIADMLSGTGIPILSEEGKMLSYEERAGWQRFWLVDPLDGTKEFIKRNGEFTVNIALVERQYPVLGVIYAPVLEQLYFADIDTGAYVSKQIGDGPVSMDTLISSSRRIHAGRQEKPYIIVASRSHYTPETESFVNGLRADHPDLDFVSRGSSLKLCLVAEGTADIYPRLAPTMEWDTCAGQAIVEGAGGKVIDYTTGDKLKYNKKELLNPWFIASS